MIGQVEIRSEHEADAPAVRLVNELAFGQPNEADIVAALHVVGAAAISLVAVLEDEIVGHILFSAVSVQCHGSREGRAVAPTEDARSWPALALGPMAVHPDHQRRGIGSALVRAGLDACRDAGERIVFVLGHPEYYPRFGFTPAPPRGLTCKWRVPDEIFMVAELAPGALAGRSGRVEYHATFDDV